MLKWSWIDLVNCMSFFPSNSSNICKISCIPGLLFGSSCKKQMSWKLYVYYLIPIHCNQTMKKHVPINGTICSCFNIQWQDWNISFTNKCWKQPMSLFNNFILLTLKIGYLLSICITHENGLEEFQVKYGFLNVPFTCTNLFRKFYMFIE
jgi:hypothetical protein